MREFAYEDRPLPIGYGQTISQPFMVASMLAEAGFTGDERVLDVGTGSGYQAAILGEITRDVVSIEIVPELALRASRTLSDLGIHNVVVVTGDGSVGWPDAAPYDVILVAAAAPRVPDELVEQLADGGRLLMPVGPSHGVQVLTRVTRRGERPQVERLDGCMFVPLVGRRGDDGGAHLH
jgi:protein-L-isoaspartate(D-aspartate) O-methyltransferase